MHGWFGIEKFVAETHSPPYHHCWLMMTMVMIMMSLRDIVCIFLILTTNRNRNCPVATGTERERAVEKKKHVHYFYRCHVILSYLVLEYVCLFFFSISYIYIYCISPCILHYGFLSLCRRFLTPFAHSMHLLLCVCVAHRMHRWLHLNPKQTAQQQLLLIAGTTANECNAKSQKSESDSAHFATQFRSVLVYIFAFIYMFVFMPFELNVANGEWQFLLSVPRGTYSFSSMFSTSICILAWLRFLSITTESTTDFALTPVVFLECASEQAVIVAVVAIHFWLYFFFYGMLYERAICEEAEYRVSFVHMQIQFAKDT